jgi:tetratricopeptide (TPR) repeat protein
VTVNALHAIMYAGAVAATLALTFVILPIAQNLVANLLTPRVRDMLFARARPIAASGSRNSPWLVPDYLLSEYFTGREDVLKRLTDELARDSRVVVTGLGGIGKSHAVLEYARRNRARYTNGVFWSSADSEISLRSTYVRIAKLLGLDEVDTGDEDLMINAVRAWFNSRSSWLLVLDNVDEHAVVASYLPRPGYGNVILTTRDATFADFGVTCRILVGEFSASESVDFLLLRTGHRKVKRAESRAAASLAEGLGHLPLALEQAAAYIAVTSCSFEDYGETFERNRIELLARTPALRGGSRETIATTWSTNFDALAAVAPASADVLRLACFLHPDRIPMNILAVAADLLGPAVGDVLAMSAGRLALDDLLAPLLRYSLIRADRAAATFSVHRLVQAVFLSRIDAVSAREWRNRSVGAISKTLNEQPPPDGGSRDDLLAQARHLVAGLISRDLPATENDLVLVRQLAKAYAFTRYPDSMRLYEWLVQQQRELLGSDSPDVAQTLLALAALYIHLQRYEDVHRCYAEALAIQEAQPDVSRDDVANTLESYGTFELLSAHYSDALALLERAYSMRTSASDDDRHKLAETLGSIAEVYRRQRDFSNAEPLFTRALSLTDESRRSALLYNLGGMYQEQGRDEEALQIYQDLLKARSDPFFTYLLFHSLAVLYQDRGDFAEAETYYLRSIKLLKELIGDQRFEGIESCHGAALDELAEFYRRQGLYAKALAASQRALPIIEDVYGPDSGAAAHTLEKRGSIEMGLSRYVDAADSYRRCLAILISLSELHGNSIVSALNSLSGAYRCQGEYELAYGIYAYTAKLLEEREGSDGAVLADVLEAFASFCTRFHMVESAGSLYERVFAIRERTLGPDHPEVGAALSRLATARHEEHRFEDALSLYQRAVEVQEREHDSDGLALAQTLHNFAALCITLERFPQAQLLCERSIQIQRSGEHPDDAGVADTMIGLAQALEGQGKIDQAIVALERGFALTVSLPQAHSVAAKVAYSLARLRQRHDQYNEAKNAFQQAITILERADPTAIQNLAMALDGLAETYDAMGEPLNGVAARERAQRLRAQLQQSG